MPGGRTNASKVTLNPISRYLANHGLIASAARIERQEAENFPSPLRQIVRALSSRSRRNIDFECGRETSADNFVQWWQKASTRHQDSHPQPATRSGIDIAQAGYLPDLVKIRRKNRNTLRMSRKMEAASNGAEAMFRDVRSRWKSTIVKPAKITRPSTE